MSDTWTGSDGQELLSGAAMEAIISAAETGLTGSLVGSNIPWKQRHRHGDVHTADLA